MARRAGVRFTNISEPGRGLVLNAAQVKSMTGNDTLNARFLHENSFDFKPQFKLYINTNYLPVINDMTLFSSGRVVIIPFERHFEEAEQDRTLKTEFSRPENQSAILNWLVEGYRLTMQEGLQQPAAVKAATAEYKRDSDKVTQFVEEKLEAAPLAETKTSLVYDCYRAWCSENGCYAESNRNFNQALRSFAEVVRKHPREGGGQTTMLRGYRIKGMPQAL
jgi:putative DNA primase/helicase